MIKRTDNISKLVVLAEDKNACEVGLMKKDGNKTVGEYIDSIANSGVELSHFMWGRKNFQGDISDDVLFVYSKEIIDRIGTKRALKRFKNNGIILTEIENDYIKQIGDWDFVKDNSTEELETPKSEVKKETPPVEEVAEPKEKKKTLSWDERKKQRRKKK